MVFWPISPVDLLGADIALIALQGDSLSVDLDLIGLESAFDEMGHSSFKSKTASKRLRCALMQLRSHRLLG